MDGKKKMGRKRNDVLEKKGEGRIVAAEERIEKLKIVDFIHVPTCKDKRGGKANLLASEGGGTRGNQLYNTKEPLPSLS